DLLRRACRAQADAPAEERVHAEVRVGRASEVEEDRAVEEKIALLGEEERIAREVHLALVDFGLCKIGVDREVRAQQRRRIVEEIDAGRAVAVERSVAASG